MCTVGHLIWQFSIRRSPCIILDKHFEISPSSADSSNLLYHYVFRIVNCFVLSVLKFLLFYVAGAKGECREIALFLQNLP